MPKSFQPMPGNMNNLLKQAQKMQRQMAETQDALESRLFESSVGGGVVKAVVNGKKQVERISVSKDVIDPDDAETLEDLLKAAVNEAMRMADETASQELSKITGGLGAGLPGLF
jgi:DNA-binding YbaB/EbfC family protein